MLLAAALLCLVGQARAELDLTGATVALPAACSPLEKQAATLLTEETAKRSNARWPVVGGWPTDSRPVIGLCLESALKDFAPFAVSDYARLEKADAPEAFSILATVRAGLPVVLVVGKDTRGVMFGAGRLLREMKMDAQGVSCPSELKISTAPHNRLRGHQLGYRPKTNSYDAWDVDRWEQYIRDLVVFGCNAIELIPPRSDDDATSPHFPKPPLQMMVEMSRLADAYGMDVWIWFAAMDPDYSNPKTVEFALAEWAEVFKRLPRLDAVFVPGGDPGHTPPGVLMNLLRRQTENLHRFHPKAQMWVSPQSFTAEWTEQFLGILNNEKPDWLSGVVFGPQVRMRLADLRKAVPARYPIRHYPDITHSRQCQYPVPDWDVAYAVTEARECINPRPEGEAIIFRATQADTVGFLTYSEGCNDDVNKFVWSALGWDPAADTREILREYSRYFIGEHYRDDFADGLLSLEKNWKGPLLANEGVNTTLQQFQSMERAAPKGVLQNWRFQQALFRAYYDAYTRARLVHETAAEERAMEKLRQAASSGSAEAMARAATLLNEAATNHPAADWRNRVFALAEDLYQSIRMQLSVEKYKAIAVDRGASLDTLDYPLNNAPWLKDQFAAISRLKTEPERLAALDAIVNWTNPGPGGYYDDLGNGKLQPHVLRGGGFAKDPAAMDSPRVDFEEDLVVDEPDENPGKARRVSWIDHMESLYEAPLQMRYENLDPGASYKLRVVYAGDAPKRKIRLVANKDKEIHPLIQKPFPFKPVEFDIPAAATRDGALTLSWYRAPGLGDNGRGCQVAEVWLIKKR